MAFLFVWEGKQGASRCPWHFSVYAKISCRPGVSNGVTIERNSKVIFCGSLKLCSGPKKEQNAGWWESGKGNKDSPAHEPRPVNPCLPEGSTVSTICCDTSDDWLTKLLGVPWSCHSVTLHQYIPASPISTRWSFSTKSVGDDR